DGVPAWREGAGKGAIGNFVARVTAEGSADFVPVTQRIAVFDNDGTLSVEQPAPAQMEFEMACVSIVGPEHPEWNSTQPFKAALAKDTAFLASAGEEGFAEILVATHVGWSTDDYETTLSTWIATTRHHRFERPTPSSSTSRCWSCCLTSKQTASRTTSCRATAATSCAPG